MKRGGAGGLGLGDFFEGALGDDLAAGEDIAHYHKIVVALSETIRLMAGIDEVIAAHDGRPETFQPKEA